MSPPTLSIVNHYGLFIYISNDKELRSGLLLAVLPHDPERALSDKTTCDRTGDFIASSNDKTFSISLFQNQP
jgi:hypothetical protein